MVEKEAAGAILKVAHRILVMPDHSFERRLIKRNKRGWQVIYPPERATVTGLVLRVA